MDYGLTGIAIILAGIGLGLMRDFARTINALERIADALESDDDA